MKSTRSLPVGFGIVLVALVGAIVPPGPCLAQPVMPRRQVNPSLVFPLNIAVRNVVRWNMQVDANWPDNAGYRPFRISVSPAKTLQADCRLTVVLRIVQRRWGSRYGLSVVQEIEIPAGTAPNEQVKTTISVPVRADTQAYRLEIVEDGEVISSTQHNWNPLAAGQPSIEGSPRVLVIGSADPNTWKIGQALQANEVQNVYQRSSATWSSHGPPPVPLQTFMTIAPKELPRQWIDYTCLDVVCVSLDRLKGLAKDQPDALAAILAWTTAGGNLWVYGFDGQKKPDERLDDLAKLLNLPPTEQPAQSWTTPAASDLPPPRAEIWSNQSSMGQPNMGPRPNSRSARQRVSPPGPTPVPKGKPGFVFRHYGLGMVVAMDGPNPLSGRKAWDTDRWKWLLLTVGPDRLLWRDRHGLSTTTEANPDFWDFLIPGVGLAPVTEFRILITLFVLFIGPVNYYLLRKWKRLHLMVLTVPISAAVVVVFVFAYALLADGLGTRVRAWSLTWLDQRRGEAATWARLSYYAGLTPSDGLRFSENVAIYPIRPNASSRRDLRRNERRELVWDENQHLARGWLNARTPTQYLTVRSAPTSRRLVIGPSPGLTDELEVTNELGVQIDRLAIRSKEGKYYWVANVGLGKTARATLTDLKQIKPWLGEPATANLPVSPLGAPAPIRYYDSDLLEPGVMADSILENNLSQLRGLRSGKGSILAPGRFVALVPASPEVELGTDAAREEDSFHVIVGEW
ncbi:MAG: hypothetical protein JW818_00330 [Pirellulales bacterium]|nr:hypothetical protein [Pirellulales bacterium]